MYLYMTGEIYLSLMKVVLLYLIIISEHQETRGLWRSIVFFGL